MSNLVRTYERIIDTKLEYSNNTFYFNDIGDDFYPFIRSCFPERDIVRSTSFLKTLITINEIFNIQFEEEKSLLLPILYLFGPETIGNEMILSRHPVIYARPGGTLIKDIVAKEIESEGLIEPDIREIKILDSESLSRIKKKYKKYVEPIEYVIMLFLEHKLKDRITLSYNFIFNRNEFKNNHNIIGVKEATSNIVLRTLCNNLRRLEYGNRPKYLHFLKDEKIIVPDDQKKIPGCEIDIKCIHNKMDVPECLKGYGTKNDLVTLEAIYLLNIMGYPTGTRSGPINSRKMKKSEYLYRLISPHYFNALKNYQYNCYSKYNLSPTEVEKIGTKQYYRSQMIENAVRNFLEVQKIRNQVKNVIDQSVKNLQSQNLVEELKSSYIVKNRPIYSDDNQGHHCEINFPSLLEINAFLSQIYTAERHIREKSVEWQLNKNYNN